MKGLTRAVGVGLVFIAVSFGQESSRFTFDLGAGFTEPVGNTARQFSTAGWNLEGGAGMNFNPWFGTNIDLNYNSFGINALTLSNLGTTGGGFHIFSATLDPIVHLNPHGHFDIYVTGGGGIFHNHQEFTQPGSSAIAGGNSFFGVYPANNALSVLPGSYVYNRPGIDAGAGVAFGTKFHGKFFAEAKYDRIFVGNYHIDYVPVTFGFRW